MTSTHYNVVDDAGEGLGGSGEEEQDHHYYISYGALSANRVPCPPGSGRSYYTPNCYNAKQPANPYQRGCSCIAHCRVATLLQAWLVNQLSSSRKGRLPPGPPSYPFIGNLVWFRKSLAEIEVLLRNLHAKLGPAVTLTIGPRVTIFLADRKLTHQVLIKNGAVFSDRPPVPPLSPIAITNEEHISTSFYGPRWRLLRRNMVSEILHPSRIRSYSRARSWVLDVFKARLLESAGSEPVPVQVMDQIQYAMFCLLVFMCFGDKLDEKQISEIERVQRQLLLNNVEFGLFSFFPLLAKIFLRKQWLEFRQLRKDQQDVLIPLIQARENIKNERAKQINQKDDDYIVAYADTLLDLELTEEKRKLTKNEIMGLCSEFLLGGTDTTSAALEWIMANLVKYPDIQNKLFEEIKSFMGDREKIGEGEVKEEELQNLPYLKAVVLEGLRRHPPGHFVLSHVATEDAKVGEYVVPKHANLNFMVAEMSWDPQVWEDPMSFNPDRFMGQSTSFDMTGTKEIKMMPFGVGRRMCPGYKLAILHLEYFVANLVWSFHWKAVEGDPIDLSEKQEFVVSMKNSLQANVSPRFGGGMA
ncbi:Cytochrome P450 89A2 [Linum grandiflorum]